jgi:dihydrofolate reductase
MGHPVVMGRRTWMSIGKPLDGRTNIILTHDKSFAYPGCIITSSIEQIINDFYEQDIFIIGGSEVFFQFLPYADRLYLTRIMHEFEGDTYFPVVKWEEWMLTYYERIMTDVGFELGFETWKRKTMYKALKHN